MGVCLGSGAHLLRAEAVDPYGRVVEPRVTFGYAGAALPLAV
jgi:hypothetical protein